MVVEISKEDIQSINDRLKTGFCDYQLKDGEFNTDSFKNQNTITLIQHIADEEYELTFKTKAKKGKYFISSNFNIIKDDLLNGRESRDIFRSVNKYFHDVVENEDMDFNSEKESLINFLLLTENYNKESLINDLNPSKIRMDYKRDYDKVYSDDSLNKIQKSLALKELFHMSVCQVVDDIDLFFTRPSDLTPAEEAEKNRQESEALKNDLKLS